MCVHVYIDVYIDVYKDMYFESKYLYKYNGYFLLIYSFIYESIRIVSVSCT